MSAFSYGSTFFTKADEQRELEQLSDFEKLSIIDDVYGRRQRQQQHEASNESNDVSIRDADNNNNSAANNDNNNNDNNSNRNGNHHRQRRNSDINVELLQEFYQALDRIEPLEKTQHFWHAWINHEDVVHAESDFSLFIKCENNDVERAANRICEYWNMRVEIFGMDDAFKPLSLRDNPSMRNVIPYMLKMPNLLYVLPPDDSGRVVTCWDRTGMPYSFKEHNIKDDVKIIFYVMQQLIDQYRHTGAEEVVLLHINKSSVLDLPPRNLSKLSIKTFVHCIPVKFVCCHRIVTSTLKSFAIPLFQYYISQHLRLRLKVHQYVPSKNQALLKSLSDYGLQSHNLPVSIGGTYDEKPIWIAEAEHILQEETRKKRKVGSCVDKHRER